MLLLIKAIARPKLFPENEFRKTYHLQITNYPLQGKQIQGKILFQHKQLPTKGLNLHIR